MKVIDANLKETVYAYDEVGNKISQTDPNLHTTTWEYDDLGRVIDHTLPEGMFETFTYDPVGNMTDKVDFNGDPVSYEYDVCCGRLLGKEYADGSSVSFTYTDSGKRETVIDARGTTTYSYDPITDHLLSVENPDGSEISYTYDFKGNRTSVMVASGTTYYDYDALNRLWKVTDPDSGIAEYTYDNVGNRKTVTLPNGTVTEYFYDDLNRLTGMENRKSTGETISSYTYTLGPAGNRQAVTENNGRLVNYTYDDLYRLLSEDIVDPVNGNETIIYTYDDFGNRITKTDADGTITYTYDQNDRLITESGPLYTHTFGFDDNGNTLSKSDGTNTTDYVYDFENQLVSVTTGPSTVGYGYDADGIRVAKTVDGVATQYRIDKNRDYAQVLEERDGAGSLTVSYVYGDDLISQKRGLTSYYLYDGQMSTRQLTGSDEAPLNEYIYDAFGNLTSQAGAFENNYLYTGEQYDPNAGFYYLRARYYDQRVGRFVTTDPFVGKMFEPNTLHKYMYANMNPVMNLDFKGEFTASITEVLTTIGISYALTSIVIPNFIGYKSSAGRTDVFDMYIAGGGEIGYLTYFSMFNAYIVESNTSKNEVIYSKKRGLFNVTVIGFGVGIGAILPSSEPKNFYTNEKRNIEYFDGVGRISSVGGSTVGYGVSCIEFKMAEGTQIPFSCSIGPSVSFDKFGASAFVALAYWDLIRID